MPSNEEKIQGEAPAALTGDDARRADSTVRGYLYQFWLTVEAWIELGRDDLLFVEGAEDYDVVSKDGATAIQIKDNKASGPLTLNTSGGQSAIRNFWALRKDNPGRKVRFKFITTATPGVETPGFEGDRGVELWNLCRESSIKQCGANVERIRKFLQHKSSIGQELQAFLRTASVEDIQRDLIEPFEWVFNQPDIKAIEEIVTGRLLDLGKSQGITVNDAIVLSDQLCLAVARAASKNKPERLGFADLRKQVDQKVNIEIPRETLRRLENAGVLLEQLLANSGDSAQPLPTIAAALDAFARPVLPLNVWPRQDLIDKVQASLNSGVIYLSGGAGQGKTTLVLQALSDRRDVFWLNLRDRTAEEIAHACRLLRQRIANVKNACVVLDDLNPADDPRILEREAGLVSAVVLKQSGALLITSYSEAGPRLKAVLGLTQENAIGVPVFNEDEVQLFLRDAGCPPDRLKSLARVVWMHTSGHPQLVAARISALKAKSFPQPTVDDLLDQSKDIEDARAEARAVVRSMPDYARILLYRLSFAVPALRRAHILSIAASDPPISLAGEVFDTVVGPWFQQIAPGHYRISPLLAKAGEQVLSKDEAKRVHSAIAEAILAEGTLTPSEFSGVVLHALLGEAEALLAIGARAFLTAPRRIRKELAEELKWVSGLGLSAGTRLPISNQAVRQMFRLAQWSIAELANPSQLPALTDQMEKEFSGETAELAQILPRLLYLSKLLLQKDLRLSVSDIVSYTLEFKRLSDAALAIDPSLAIGEGVPSFYKGMQRPKLSELFTVAIMPRVRTSEDLTALILLLDSLVKDDRDWLLGGLAVEDGELRVFFNAVWLSIPKDDRAAFEAYERTLASAVEAGRRWGHPAWMRAATRTRSAILDEMLSRRLDAEAVLKEIADEIGLSPNLEEQLAIIAFNHKEYATALQVWERVLPQWQSDTQFHDMQPVFGLRYAAMAASHLGDWERAAILYGQAAVRGKKFDNPGWNIGLPADRAYALWMNRDFTASLPIFADVVAKLQSLPNKPESFAEYAVQKLVGHTMSSLVFPDGENAVYLPGVCSETSPNKDLSTMPPVPAVFTWFLLLHLAATAGDKVLASACADKIRNVPFAFLRATAALDRVERTLETDDLSTIPNLAVTVAIEMMKSNRRDGLPIFVPDPEFISSDLAASAVNVFVRPALWTAVLRVRSVGGDIAALIRGWRASASGTSALVVEEITFLERFSAESVASWARTLKDQGETYERRLWASVFLVGNDETTPNDALYAQAVLINHAKDMRILREVGGNSFDELVRRDWKRFLEAAFLLRNPRVHVDGIRSACESADRGWSAAARIILIAHPTATLELPRDILDKLKEMAVNESERSARRKDRAGSA
jgi:tetratricopeptide (TPR) repeat protein